MITTPTVFILGAGASFPYGFPTGEKLHRDLIKHGKVVADRSTDGNRRNTELFRSALRGARLGSIDAFLESRQNPYLDFGKQILATELMKYEDPAECDGSPEDWIGELLPYLRSGTNDISENKVSFIVYNYDRVLEHLLTEAVHHGSGIPRSKAWEMVSKIPILHPHGLLAPYVPFPDSVEGDLTSSDRDAFPPKQGRYFWKEDFSRIEDVNRAANSINLYWQDTEVQQKIRSEMNNRLWRAKRVVFLGFGFLEANMKYLLPLLPNEAEYWGTCYQMGRRHVKRANGMISQLVPGDRFANMTCKQYLADLVPLD